MSRKCCNDDIHAYLYNLFFFYFQICIENSTEKCTKFYHRISVYYSESILLVNHMRSCIYCTSSNHEIKLYY